MSSRPGLELEDYLAWKFDLVVEGRDDANRSLQYAELLGTTERRRPCVSVADFARIVEVYEPNRDSIENWLLDFDEETQSWRNYGSYPPLDNETEGKNDGRVIQIIKEIVDAHRQNG